MLHCPLRACRLLIFFLSLFLLVSYSISFPSSSSLSSSSFPSFHFVFSLLSLPTFPFFPSKSISSCFILSPSHVFFLPVCSTPPHSSFSHSAQHLKHASRPYLQEHVREFTHVTAFTEQLHRPSHSLRKYLLRFYCILNPVQKEKPKLYPKRTSQRTKDTLLKHVTILLPHIIALN